MNFRTAIRHERPGFSDIVLASRLLRHRSIQASQTQSLEFAAVTGLGEIVIWS